MINNDATRSGFTSRFGAIAAAAGSAIGLGNIWRFPYVAGENGGGAFIVVYLIFVFMLGRPIMLSEFVIGRHSSANAMGAFRVLRPQNKGWLITGLLAVLTCTIIYSFYGVVSGWTFEYIFLATSGQLAGKNAVELSLTFANFVKSPYLPIICQLIFISLTAFIVMKGVQKGIERTSKTLMPIFFLIMLLLCIRSITLPNASQGIDFLFHPDFSKLTARSVLAALGQAIFSLSIGSGLLITFGSYMQKKDNLIKSSFFIVSADTATALLAGIAIFPAVFSFGLSPACGPSLVFEVLPNVFNSMNMGFFFAILFFVLLAIASITSTISLLEVIVVWMVEELHIKRKSATWLATSIIFIIGALCSLSLGIFRHHTIFGYTLFDICDHLTATYLMPIGALLVTIFIGWVYPKQEVMDELTNHNTIKSSFAKVFYFVIRYIAPIALTIILIAGTLGIDV